MLCQWFLGVLVCMCFKLLQYQYRFFLPAVIVTIVWVTN